MILNSTEHGSPDMLYNSKTEAHENDRYFEFIALKQKDSMFSDRKSKD